MDINKVLVFGHRYAQFERDANTMIHYSCCKSTNLAKGFKVNTPQVFHASRKTKVIIDGIEYIPIKSMNIDFLQSMDLIIFTIERHIESCLANNKDLENFIVIEKNRHPKICSRMGTYSWISKTKWSFDTVYDMFDFHFPQTDYFVKSMKNTAHGDLISKIYPSAMAVPDTIPKKSKICPFLKGSVNLIYIGRLRQSPSKLPLLKSMMEDLGLNYKLRIYCGAYNKPGESKKLSPGWVGCTNANNNEQYHWLKNYFSSTQNITVLRPLEWGSHWNHLHHSDIGIDFSPNTRSSPHPAGNAKLLEYMAAGIPTVVERGPGNLYLLEDAKGGIVLQNGASFKEYSDAIKKIPTMNFDRSKISEFTIERNCWSVRTKEILDIVKKKG